jgi:hypothetical protein
MGTFGITDFDSSNALCKDGTIDKNNPSNPCVNNGGVDWGLGTNQPVGGKDFAPKKQNDELARIQMEYALAKANENAQSKSPTKSGSSVFRKLAGAYNKNLIIAGVLVAGYFAYKKFKK